MSRMGFIIRTITDLLLKVILVGYMDIVLLNGNSKVLFQWLFEGAIPKVMGIINVGLHIYKYSS